MHLKERDLKADEEAMKVILTTDHEIFLESELIEVLVFTNEHYAPGKHLSEKPTNITNFDKVHLKRYCVDGAILSGTRENIFSLSLIATLGFKIFKQATSVLLQKVTETILVI